MTSFAIAGVPLHVRNDDSDDALERHVRAAMAGFPRARMVVVGTLDRAGCRMARH